jgi:crotonobetainyl-CoA hydratase
VASKEIVYQAATQSDWEPEAWALSDAATRAILKTADAKEGPRAFVEKRAPQWQGR